MKMSDLFKSNHQQGEVTPQSLYKRLNSGSYSQRPYERSDLGDGMSIINQVIGGYWKPRYLMDDRNKMAFEFMDEGTVLQTVVTDDIDWPLLQHLPQDATERAQRLSAHFPTSIGAYKNDVARVSWQINPDGQYFMDEDGYGMTDDEEITLYGYVDRTGKPLIKFRTIKRWSELEKMKEEAENRIKQKMERE